MDELSLRVKCITEIVKYSKLKPIIGHKNMKNCI